MNTTLRRRWLRFSLRGLLIAMALFSALIGLRVKSVRDYDRALDRIRSHGFIVCSYCDRGRYKYEHQAVAPPELYWWRLFFGENRVASSIMALEDGPPISDDVVQSLLRDLHAIGPMKEVHLKGHAITDKTLRNLESLPMKWVWLYETTVTNEGIAQLKKAQPSCLVKTWRPGKAPRIPEWFILIPSARKQFPPYEHEFFPLEDLPMAIDPDTP